MWGKQTKNKRLKQLATITTNSVLEMEQNSLTGVFGKYHHLVWVLEHVAV